MIAGAALALPSPNSSPPQWWKNNGLRAFCCPNPSDAEAERGARKCAVSQT